MEWRGDGGIRTRGGPGSAVALVGRTSTLRVEALTGGLRVARHPKAAWQPVNQTRKCVQGAEFAPTFECAILFGSAGRPAHSKRFSRFDLRDA
jgi:hypothetical protein